MAPQEEVLPPSPPPSPPEAPAAGVDPAPAVEAAAPAEAVAPAEVSAGAAAPVDAPTEPMPPAMEAEPESARRAPEAEKGASSRKKGAKGEKAKGEKEAGAAAKEGRWEHTGMIIEGKIGMLGCTRRICRSENYHNSRSPGLSLGGFLGKNFRGLVDFGLEGAWGRVRPDGYSGRNAVDLYGLDPYKLAQVLVEQTGMPGLNPDFSSLTVGTVKSRAIHAGPTLRIHLIPRGRISAYVGIGLHYQQWRSEYETLGGRLRLGFHGLSLPATAGIGAYVLRRLAVGAEFSYIHSFYMAAAVQHPELTTAAPIFLIESAALRAGTDLRADLPSFWSLGLSVRVRL